MGGSVSSAGKILNKWVVEEWWIRNPGGRRTENISILYFTKKLFNLNGEALDKHVICLLYVRQE